MYKETHRIRPLCFLDLRKRHSPISTSVFSISENIAQTGFCFFMRIKKTPTDRIMCVFTTKAVLASLTSLMNGASV